MSTRSLSARYFLRRFTLGSGPLKRRSDRVEFVSRILLALALLTAAPVGVAVGTAVGNDVGATAHEQAQTRVQAQATLLADTPVDTTFGSLQAPTQATWTGPDGVPQVGDVAAPLGSRAGTSLTIWVDHSGHLVAAPLNAATVTDQALVAGAVGFLGVLIGGLSLHMIVLWTLARSRARRWAAGWESVEPLWVSRFR